MPLWISEWSLLIPNWRVVWSKKGLRPLDQRLQVGPTPEPLQRLEVGKEEKKPEKKSVTSWTPDVPVRVMQCDTKQVYTNDYGMGREAHSAMGAQGRVIPLKPGG